MNIELSLCLNPSCRWSPAYVIKTKDHRYVQIATHTYTQLWMPVQKVRVILWVTLAVVWWDCVATTKSFSVLRYPQEVMLPQGQRKTNRRSSVWILIHLMQVFAAWSPNLSSLVSMNIMERGPIWQGVKLHRQDTPNSVCVWVTHLKRCKLLFSLSYLFTGNFRWHHPIYSQGGAEHSGNCTQRSYPLVLAKDTRPVTGHEADRSIFCSAFGAQREDFLGQTCDIFQAEVMMSKLASRENPNIIFSTASVTDTSEKVCL